MSPNAEAVMRAYAAFNAQDLEAAEAVIDPSIVWTQLGEGPNAGTFRGLPELKKHMEDESIFQTFPDYRIQPVEWFETGDHVVVITTATGTGGEAGLLFELRLIHMWRMHDGKAIEVLEIGGEPHAL